MAISKLCAVFQIGPDVETSIPYDVIVYEDVIQFHLEKCDAVCFDGDVLFTITRNKSEAFKADIRRCLKRLHNLHIAHKDVKPSNILYCQRLKKFVLCDYGCAEYVQEEIGQLSKTVLAGTGKFMGPEMLEILTNTKRKKVVDLYYNDVAACEIFFKYLL